MTTSQTRIELREQLSRFPEQLYEHADKLEYLDLSGNQLSELPADMYRFRALKVLFLSQNQFKIFPSSLAGCPQLKMVGFKSNQIGELPADSLPAQIRWLILTDNRLASLPNNIGNYKQLQKLMLAGNHLQTLPANLSDCQNLELIRIAANRFKQLPDSLFQLTRLAWLAFAGNPCSQTQAITHDIATISWSQLQHQGILGRGASGEISKVQAHSGQTMALKLFHGQIGSDGYPHDEIQATLTAGNHPNLVPVLAKLIDHPQQQAGLLLQLISTDWYNLAAPPSLDSCTRDMYPTERRFNLCQLLQITHSTASVMQHLHQRQLKHGDLYGHNILINSQGGCLLGDLGATSHYGNLPITQQQALQAIEVRAWGCLLEELLERLDQATPIALQQLKQQCLQDAPQARPNFQMILEQLNDLR